VRLRIYTTLLLFILLATSCNYSSDRVIKYKPIAAEFGKTIKKAKQFSNVNTSLTNKVKLQKNNGSNFFEIKPNYRVTTKTINIGFKAKIYKRLLTLSNINPNTKVKVELNRISIKDLIDLVFGNILKVNYMVIPSEENLEQQEISLKIKDKIKVGTLLKLTLNILERNGIVIEYNKATKTFLIEKVPSILGRIPLMVGTQIPNWVSNEDIVSILYPIQNQQIVDVLSTLKTYVLPPDVTLTTTPEQSYIIITGSAASIRKSLRILNFFNKKGTKKKYISVIPINSQNREVVNKIRDILTKIGITTSFNLSETGVSLISTRNRLILVSPSKTLLSTVQNLVKRLSSTYSNVKINKNLLIFEPMYRNAEEIFNILNTYLGKSKKRKENFFLILDKTRNQILIKGDKETINTILSILKKIDLPPKQVLVEVTIAEITLKDQLEYGLEWYLRHSGKFNGEGGTLGGLGIGGAGFVYSLVTSSQKFRLIFNAFAKKNLIRILSSPHLVVLSGKKASINVGTEVPVISSEVSAPDITTTQKPSILRNVTYRKTGVQLSIEPIVSSKGMVELIINQQVSEAQTNNISKIDSPLILNRSINTDVFVKSGETVILGGLISNTKSNSQNKTPFIGDLPLIGNLFKTSSSSSVKTELVVIITPYILNSPSDYEAISQEVLSNLKIGKTTTKEKSK
jgi:general secretion pathway protein D